ncbi:MAG TPA: hypothetical protein VLT33_07250 [Labilithrix sp.]|nr:hypothetical protein [Labilithrix sp.]
MRWRVAFAFACACACSTQEAPVALDEPIRIRDGQFMEGALPADTGGPAVTIIQAQNPVILPGQAGKLLTGRARDSASSIAVRFADLGTGYWVFVLGGPDPQYPGELTWSATGDFARAVPPGPRTLRAVAIDERGAAGPTAELTMCFSSTLPDGLHACDPSRPLPDVVITLAWDNDADLDLVVALPDGRTVDAKHAASAEDAGADAPRFGRDSLAGCARDGVRQESLVFPKRPSGTLGLYASLFDACGTPATRFTATVYEAQGEGAARRLVPTLARSGRVLDLDALGGTTRGLFIDERTF